MAMVHCSSSAVTRQAQTVGNRSCQTEAADRHETACTYRYGTLLTLKANHPTARSLSTRRSHNRQHDPAEHNNAAWCSSCPDTLGTNMNHPDAEPTGNSQLSNPCSQQAGRRGSSGDAPPSRPSSHAPVPPSITNPVQPSAPLSPVHAAVEYVVRPATCSVVHPSCQTHHLTRPQ